MIRFALCDDEPFMLEDINGRICTYMKSRALSFEILQFSSSRQLLESALPFEILFLDILMSEPDGMETAARLRRKGFEGMIIFITGLKEYVFDAFQVEAFDYLLKPLEESRFQNTMDRVLAAAEKQTARHILIRQGSSCRILPMDDILYCEVMGRKIYLHTKNGEIIDYYCRLDRLEQTLDSRFFRCHRSYLVNLDYVQGLKDENALVPGNCRIPVSRLRRQMLTDKLLNRMKERRR